MNSNSLVSARQAQILPFCVGDRSPPGAFRRVALVGNFPPRKCGIATFTNGIFEQVSRHHPQFDFAVYAPNDPGTPTSYSHISATIAYDDLAAYRRAAIFIKSRRIVGRAHSHPPSLAG